MPDRVPRTSAGVLRTALAAVFAACWGALLVARSLQPELLSRWTLLQWAPLGFVMVFVFPDRTLRVARALLVGAPAFVLSLAAAFLVIALREQEMGPPGPSDLLRPALAITLGVVVGLAARRGVFAVLLLPVKLAVLGLLLAGVAAGWLVMATESAPAVEEPPELSAIQRQKTLSLFAGKDPAALPPYERCSLRLTQQDLDQLTALASPLLVEPARARVRIVLAPDDAVSVRSSVRIPMLVRWLNLECSARAAIAQRRLEIRGLHLRAGRFTLPPTLSEPLAPLVAAALRAERPLRPVCAGIHSLQVENGTLSVSYGRFERPRGGVLDLVFGARSGKTSAGVGEADPVDARSAFVKNGSR